MSDKPGVSYYYRAVDRNGKEGPLRCRRGTSQIEALHYHLRRLLHGAHNIGQRKAILLLAEYLGRWNSRQAARSHGEPWYQWYDFGKMEDIVELAAQCGVVEYPHLRLTSEYEVDPEHVFYAWPSTAEDDDAMEEGTGSTEDDEDIPSLQQDSDSEDEDVEMIEAGREREQQIENTVRDILRCSDRPKTRDELTRLGRNPNPSGPTPSQLPANGDDQLVTTQSLSMYEWSLLRDFGAKGRTVPNIQGADDYVKQWNAHARAAAARGLVDGCHYQLRKIDKQLAVDMSALQVTLASSSPSSSTHSTHLPPLLCVPPLCVHSASSSSSALSYCG